MKHLGKALKYLRIFKGFSATDLARKLSVTRATVSSVELGKHYPSVQLLAKYSEVCDISISQIFALAEWLDNDEPMRKVDMVVMEKWFVDSGMFMDM